MGGACQRSKRLIDGRFRLPGVVTFLVPGETPNHEAQDQDQEEEKGLKI